MIKVQFLDSYIGKKLLEANTEERKNHVSSGKLSASSLGNPVQWQILHVIGVPQEEKDEYTLRKFKRGNHVEDWLVSNMCGIVNKQKYVEYKNTVGYADTIVDMRDWGLPQFGVIPHEIKSVSNLKYKRIMKEGSPDEHHILQACLYALALGTDYFAIDYVATDDYRIDTSVMKTSDYAKKVDGIIDAFQNQLSKGEVPAFVPVQAWQANDEYNNYKRFSMLTPSEISAVLEKEYPECFIKLQKEKK